MKRERTRDEYKAASKALLMGIDEVRRQKGMRQMDVSCPRCDFNQATYCLAQKRGSVYLSTFLAFCGSLGVRVALYDENGSEVDWERFVPDLLGKEG